MLIKKIKIVFTLVFLLNILLILSSCGPINRFTRVKKIPREYSLNYCGGDDIKAPKTDLNKDPWIVYSDRSENLTYNSPGGRVKAKDIDYLDAFLVIGSKHKGEYLKLIKYNSDVLKNGKLDYKKAEYYGWVPKSKLLLNSQTKTDIKSGYKIKTLTILSDSLPIDMPDTYFEKDSIKLYKDLEFKSTTKLLAPYSIVYKLKESEDGSMSLISKKTIIKVENVKDEILGWVDNSLIKDIGTGLHVDLKTLPLDEDKYLLRNKENGINITRDILDNSNMLGNIYKTAKYSPVQSYSIKDSLIAFKTQVALPLFDYSNNYIFNVLGDQISSQKFKVIAKNLKRINISIVFEAGEHTIKEFPQIVNALQGLQSLFDQEDNNFSFQFNTVFSFDESGKLIRPIATDFTSDYSQVLNGLTEKANLKNKLQGIKVPLNSWPALRKSVETFNTDRNETNLIVLIGDKRQNSNSFERDFYNKIIKNNCRIIGFQIYGGEGDSYNNFVLDIEDLINNYSEEMLKTKKKILVSPEQLKRSNNFVQIEPNLNNYRLDFPNSSITQGGIFFPSKNELLSMEIITNNIDTIIQQIKQDNISLTNYMSRSFRSVGNNRTRFDSLFIKNYNIGSNRTPKKTLISNLSNIIPAWYMSSNIVVLKDSLNNTVNYKLLISKEEMIELRKFITSLSAKEVDIISQSIKKKKRTHRKPCNCIDEDLFAEIEVKSKEYNVDNDTIMNLEDFYTKKKVDINEYSDTKHIRNYLVKTFLKPLKYCKLCKEKKNNLETLTLADVQYRITGCPSSNNLLKHLKIKDLKRKDVVSDEQLDKLITYYKFMKSQLDKSEQFDSNGETFYWVDKKLLP